MIEKKYKQYIEIKKQIADLEETLKEIGSELRDDIVKHNDEPVETQYGTFYITRRKKWEYSEVVSALEMSLKETKKEEEKTGMAKVVDETVSLTFRGKK